MNHEHQTGEGNAATHAGAERLVRLPECLQAVSLGRTAWLDLVKEGAAPQPIRIGRASCWVWSEVQAFIADRIRQSRGA